MYSQVSICFMLQFSASLSFKIWGSASGPRTFCKDL